MALPASLFVRVGRMSAHLPSFRGRTRGFLILYNLLRLGREHILVEAKLRKPTPYLAVLDLHSWLQRLAFLTGAYEEDTVDFLHRLHGSVGSRGYVLDVGANIGLISVPLALLLVHERSLQEPCVVAIEAVPDNAASLRKNVKLNSLENSIQVLEMAVGDTEKDIDIQVEGDLAAGEGTGTANILPDGSKYECSRQTLRLTTLDSLLGSGRLPPGCSVIKIDADGYDLKVLQGARELIDRDRPVVYGEFSSHCMAWHGQSLEDILSFARGRNYVAWLRRSNSWEFSPAETSAGFVQDLLLVPCEKVALFDWCRKAA